MPSICLILSATMKTFSHRMIVGFLSLAMYPLCAELPSFEWKAVTIDTIEIGYGLQLTDVDGDGKTDIVLADKSTVQWYENPAWKKHVIASKLTLRDNVC